MNLFRRSPLQTHRVSGDGRGWVDTVAVPLFAANASIYVAISPLRDGLFGKSVSCQIGLCIPLPSDKAGLLLASFRFSSRAWNQYLLITGYFRHIVHVDIDKNRVLPLTHGPYEVNRLLHWDQLDNWM